MAKQSRVDLKSPVDLVRDEIIDNSFGVSLTDRKPTDSEIERLFVSRIDAIRAYRARTGLGIREALDAFRPHFQTVVCPKCQGFGKIRVPPPQEGEE